MSGQWIYEDDDNTDTAHYVRDAETGEVVLIVPFDPDDDESFEAAKRRAIRASALPDLEEACQKALDVFGDKVLPSQPTEQEAREFEAVLCLTAAIAKAKGEPA